MDYTPLEEIYNLFMHECSQLYSTDSRSIPEGSLFIALRGENFDGNEFALQALSSGARYCVVDNPAISGDNVFLVKDTLKTLQELAAHHRTQQNIPLIAIGGSNGKTSTRSFTVQILSRFMNVHSNKGNENNHIGVPKTILETPSNTEIIIMELGSNHVGEHDVLLNICQPDFVLITNNGCDHIGEYGSLEAITHENSALYRYAYEHHLTAFVPEFHIDLMELSSNLERIVYTRPPITQDLPLTINYSGVSVTTKLFGSFNAENIAAATAIAKHMKYSDDDIQEALQELEPFKLRGEVLHKDSVVYVVDCYNANPSSMIESISAFHRATSGKTRSLIIGGMRELGVFTHDEHQKVINFINTFSWSDVYLVGHEWNTCIIPEEWSHWQSTSEAAAHLHISQSDQRYVLIKGSRGYALEKLL
jgi:UDP-N-acetylmuramoyl-tripeptide--D-alanyl-D-alanine ligase